MNDKSKAFSRENLAWAAGLFEGEGTFSTRLSGKVDRGLIAKVKMSDEDAVRRFYKIIRVGNVTGPYTIPKKKPVWIWQTGSFEGVQLTIALLWEWLCSRRRSRAKELLILFHQRESNLVRKPKRPIQ